VQHGSARLSSGRLYAVEIGLAGRRRFATLVSGSIQDSWPFAGKVVLDFGLARLS